MSIQTHMQEIGLRPRQDFSWTHAHGIRDLRKNQCQFARHRFELKYCDWEAAGQRRWLSEISVLQSHCCYKSNLHHFPPPNYPLGLHLMSRVCRPVHHRKRFSLSAPLFSTYLSEGNIVFTFSMSHTIDRCIVCVESETNKFSLRSFYFYSAGDALLDNFKVEEVR